MSLQKFYLSRMADTPKPFDNPRIFWDVDYTKMDYHAKANFIIERVFERGDVQDIRNCRRYYGDEKVTAALLKAKFLSFETISLVAACLDKKMSDFKSFGIAKPNRANLFRYKM